MPEELLASYRAHGGHDEMLRSAGPSRDAWDRLGDILGPDPLTDLNQRARRVAGLLADHGTRLGTDDHAWQLDPVPVMLDESEWSGLEAGLGQRARVLDAALTDLYGPRRLLTEGVLPPEMVLGHPDFTRAADGIRLPGPHQLFMHAADLARNADGNWAVVADRARVPTGLGYVMEDRRVLAQVLAGLYRQVRIRRLGPFFHAMRAALREVAPARAGGAPRIAMLTAGAASENPFDDGYLAGLLGVPQVTGDDLVVADGRLWLRSLEDLEPVDVLIRRIPGDLCDPLDLRGDSTLGVPGLLEAARAGGVSIVNPIGAGILEHPALHTYLPRISRHLLGEELILPSGVTYWCGERSMHSHVIANLDRLVIMPTARNAPTLDGAAMTIMERAELAARISANPHLWGAREPIEVSTTPGVTPDGLAPRPTTLRTFTVARGDGYRTLPGALARTTDTAAQALDPGRRSAKDTWILSDAADPAEDALPEEDAEHRPAARALSTGAAEYLYRFGRYSERVEAGARLLRATVDLWEDRPPAGSPAARAVEVLMAALADVFGPGDLAELTHGEGPRGLRAAVGRLVRTATPVRDQLTTETWLALAALQRTLAAPDPERGLIGALSRALESLSALSGVAAESMVRDAGWHLMDAGRRIERARLLTATLAVTLTHHHGPGVEALVLEAVLTAQDSVLTYRRRSQAAAPTATALDLLLLDRTNPRSLAFCLATLRADLDALPVDGGQRDQLLVDVTNLLAEADPAVLAGVDENGVRTRLVELDESVRWRLDELAEAISRDYFARAHSAPWQDAVDPIGADR